MQERALARMLAPYARRLGNLFARGVVAASNAAGKMQTLQARLLADEVKDNLEHFEPYGYTSRPKPGAEVIAAFLDGDRTNGFILVAADRRYRITALEEGEVALYDDLGHVVHLTRAGIVIKGAGHPVTITNTPKLRVEADIEATGQIKDLCDGAGATMAGMRSTYNSHTHPGDSGGTTGAPNQGM